MFEHVRQFEEQIADFYGAPYAVATDSCTHAIELCLRLHYPLVVPQIPKHTYLSVPMTFMKLEIPFLLTDRKWSDWYPIADTNIIDAAVYWEEGGYIPDTNMCLSFQFKKHLSLGRGGMILTDNEDAVTWFKRARYEGRSEKFYKEDEIDMLGWNMYMTPQQAAHGLSMFQNYPEHMSDLGEDNGYRDLTEFTVYEDNKVIE